MAKGKDTNQGGNPNHAQPEVTHFHCVIFESKYFGIVGVVK